MGDNSKTYRQRLHEMHVTLLQETSALLGEGRVSNADGAGGPFLSFPGGALFLELAPVSIKVLLAISDEPSWTFILQGELTPSRLVKVIQDEREQLRLRELDDPDR